MNTVCLDTFRSRDTTNLHFIVYLFFSEFSLQIPLFHRPTWRAETTHPILLTAMQACGALFAKTPSSMDFIIQTLTSSRDALILEFVCFLISHQPLSSLTICLFSLMSIGFRSQNRHVPSKTI